MNRTLAILFLIGAGFGVMAMAFDSGTTVDFAGGLYTIAGLMFYVFGTWLSIRVLMEK